MFCNRVLCVLSFWLCLLDLLLYDSLFVIVLVFVSPSSCVYYVCAGKVITTTNGTCGVVKTVLELPLQLQLQPRRMLLLELPLQLPLQVQMGLPLTGVSAQKVAASASRSSSVSSLPRQGACRTCASQIHPLSSLSRFGSHGRFRLLVCLTSVF